jgi:hypothetical protein
MNKLHVSEEKIQQYAIGELTDEETITHIGLCEQCRLKAVAYRLIVEEMKASTKPVFEFDLATAVLDQIIIEQPTTEKWYFSDYLVWLFAILLFAIPAFVYRNVMADFMTNVQPTVLATVVITAPTIIVFRVFELNHKLGKQTSLLNSFRKLQH